MKENNSKELMDKYKQIKRENNGKSILGKREIKKFGPFGSMLDLFRPGFNPYIYVGILMAHTTLDTFPDDFSENDIIEILRLFLEEFYKYLKNGKDSAFWGTKITKYEYEANWTYFSDLLKIEYWEAIDSALHFQYSNLQQSGWGKKKDKGFELVEKFVVTFFNE